MTHVDVPTNFTSSTGHIDLNDDGIGYVKSYDFSTANLSHEHRIAAISAIASVCYANPKAVGSISLYDRLANESAGLPSTSFEMCPVLIYCDSVYTHPNTSFEYCIKYGEWIKHENSMYLLTNLRALIADIGEQADKFYNTPEECAIIAKHFKIFKSKIDLSTARQFMRHRVSWQELSRRYVSGNRVPFEFYISPKIIRSSKVNEAAIALHMQKSIDIYDYLISEGVKPEEARRVLPQAMYTTVWSAWTPKPLDIFFKLRLDAHSQSQISELASGMQTLIKGTK